MSGTQPEKIAKQIRWIARKKEAIKRFKGFFYNKMGEKEFNKNGVIKFVDDFNLGDNKWIKLLFHL